MSEQKKAPPPSLFDNAQPRTSIKVLQQNKRDYIARNKVWGIAFISFFMGCMLATTGAWLLIPRNNSSMDNTLQIDLIAPALPNVQTDSAPISEALTSANDQILESTTNNQIVLDNRKNPLAVFNDEQAIKSENQTSPSNPFKVLEKDNSKINAKKASSKKQETSSKKYRTEPKNTKKEKATAHDSKKESESSKQRKEAQKKALTKKETPKPTTITKKIETQQAPKKQLAKPDPIEELIKKL